MSSHVPYLEKLVNHLKNDVNLPELLGRYVFVKSQYRGIDEDNQCAPAVWIIPGDTGIHRTPANSTTHDCKVSMAHRFKVCAVVRCPSNTRNQFDQSIESNVDGTTTTTMMGNFIKGAELLCRVRQSILECNLTVQKLRPKPCYTPLQLLRIFEPDEHNDHLIHCMEYQTTYIY